MDHIWVLGDLPLNRVLGASVENHPSERLNWNVALEMLSHTDYEGDVPTGPYWLGDSNESSNELVQLVISGKKRGTASLLAEWEFDNEKVTEPGAIELLLNWDNTIACVVETTEVKILPFSNVTAEFAYLEGEGDRSLHYWREVHSEFFDRVCKRIGVVFNRGMLVVCESFTVKHLAEVT